MDQCEKYCENLDFFKSFFEPTRYELVKYLYLNPNLSINEIAKEFTQNRSVISRHLDHLYRNGILNKYKESRYTYYNVNSKEIIKRFEGFTDILKQLDK